jgi:hypothetical protein
MHKGAQDLHSCLHLSLSIFMVAVLVVKKWYCITAFIHFHLVIICVEHLYKFVDYLSS